jgi:hypothetical protein
LEGVRLLADYAIILIQNHYILIATISIEVFHGYARNTIVDGTNFFRSLHSKGFVRFNDGNALPMQAIIFGEETLYPCFARAGGHGGDNKLLRMGGNHCCYCSLILRMLITLNFRADVLGYLNKTLQLDRFLDGAHQIGIKLLHLFNTQLLLQYIFLAAKLLS